MKNDRLFQMLYLLLEKGSMTAPELSRELEVSVRTVYRYVESLSMSGIPVYTSVGKGGGISLLDGYSFDKSLLSDDEINQLLFSLQSLQATGQQVDGLLHKLSSSFQKARTDWIVVDFSRWGLNRTDTERFELLKTAIIGKQVLHLIYCGASGETTTRLVHPIRLIYKDKHWYLQGYCLYADDFRLFKMGRIIKVALSGESFTQDYTPDIPPIEVELATHSTTHIRLRFSKQVAFRVYDEFNHDAIVSEPDGSLSTEISFPLDNWTINYLFSFGTDVEILEPIEIKELLKDYAKKIWNHYQT